MSLNPEGDSLGNLPEILDLYGFRSGIITIDQLTDATPGSFYAHHFERNDSDQIAAFLPKSKLDLFIGGGGRDFTRFELNRKEELEKTRFTLVKSLDKIWVTGVDRIGYFVSEDRYLWLRIDAETIC